MERQTLNLDVGGSIPSQAANLLEISRCPSGGMVDPAVSAARYFDTQVRSYLIAETKTACSRSISSNLISGTKIDYRIDVP